MIPGGRIHLKTDSRELYEFTQEVVREYNCPVIEDIADIYGKGKAVDALAIQTHYEGLHLADGRTINYISFRLPEAPIILPEKEKVETEDAAEGA